MPLGLHQCKYLHLHSHKQMTPTETYRSHCFSQIVRSFPDFPGGAVSLMPHLSRGEESVIVRFQSRTGKTGLGNVSADHTNY